ncbi:hypothetical protein DFS34DRAFT_96893 [Phlyctochytrium arcticum]|nr:hypothetical protein DFS34DRAFT_96893 [Phlyctochytrium arcticum]
MSSSPHRHTRSSLFLIVLAVCLLVPTVFGYPETVPAILWSGQKFKKSVQPSSFLTKREDFLPLFDNVGCKQVNLVFDQKDLHALDLPHLAPSTKQLRRSVDEAADNTAVSFVAASQSLQDVVNEIQRVCREGKGVEAIVLEVADAPVPDLNDGQTYIIRVVLSSVNALTLPEQLRVQAENDGVVAGILSNIQSIVKDDWAAVLTSSSRRTLYTRAEKLLPRANSTLPWSKRSIFQKYVFFTPGLFMTLFAIAPVIIIALLGVTILSGVQSPNKIEAPKKEK